MRNHRSAFVCALTAIGFFACLVAINHTHTANARIYAATDPLRFGVIGDFGLDGANEASVAALVKSWNPDLIVTLGDNNYYSGSASTIDKNTGQYYHDYLYPYTGTFGSGEPAQVNRFFPVLGNHDWISLTCKNGACRGPYFDYFSLPGNERYYDYVRGSVHFFVVDSDPHEPDGITSASIQANWLRARLAAAQEPWKLVLMHHPPYSSGASHGSTSDLQWPYAQWGATAVLSGHDHTYERLSVNGLPYFVNGSGGAEIYNFATPVPGSEVRYNSAYGAILIEASAVTITFQFINVANTLIDTYRLSALTSTPTNTPTESPINTSTSTLTPTNTPINILTATLTPTNTPINILTPTPTNTPNAATPSASSRLSLPLIMH